MSKAKSSEMAQNTTSVAEENTDKQQIEEIPVVISAP